MSLHDELKLASEDLIAEAHQMGTAYACALFTLAVQLNQWPEDTGQEIAEQATRALLQGFITPILPVLTDALTLFSDDMRAGLLEGIIEDLAHGAALVVETAQPKGGAHG